MNNCRIVSGGDLVSLFSFPALVVALHSKNPLLILFSWVVAEDVLEEGEIYETDGEAQEGQAG